ncbi:MAG: hypothetical protein KGJ35_02240 [Patescibacteria group bacterium]|nr:hypothetical protein [Patescibacteria group bacterium]
MSRKLFYSIVVIVIAAVVGGAWYLFFYVNRPAPAGGNGTGTNPFTPFGSGLSGNPSSRGTSNATGTIATGVQMGQWPKIRKIYSTPIGGFIASSTGATSTIVRFVDRGTGYVYNMDMNSAAPTVISNTTVPLIYESYWQGNAAAAIFRYIKEGTDDITNFYVRLIATATGQQSASSTSATSTAQIITETPYSLRGAYFPGNVIDMAVSPSGKQLFTIENVNGNGVGFISNFDGSGSKQIFSTPLTQVRAFWPTTNTVMMATNGTAVSPGFLYEIDAKSGVMSEVFGNINGLSVLPSPNGNLVAYSDISKSGQLVTSLYNIKTSSSQDLPFTTLADKCVWSKANPLNLYCAVPTPLPQAVYPDNWYQGAISTTDSIFEIDTDTGTVHPVADLQKEAGASVDAEWLALDPKEHYLYFVNKKDLSLWSVDLNQVGR